MPMTALAALIALVLAAIAHVVAIHRVDRANALRGDELERTGNDA